MATLRQKKAVKETLENLGSENPKPQGEILLKNGYSPAIAKNPKIITESKGWKELMDKYMDDESIAKKHHELLNSTRMDHMVFPLGPKDEDDINFSGARVRREKDELDEAQMPEEYKERTTLTDKEIIAMLAEVNCTVRRIVHGETARHVYFWSPDNRSRKEALDMAYKLKGSYAPEKSTTLNVNMDVKTEPAELEALRLKYEEDLRGKYLNG